MKRTFFVYGVFTTIVLLEALTLKFAGLSKPGNILLYILPINALLLAIAICIDPFGLLCIALAWLPFSQGMLQIEIGFITFNPYTLCVIGLIIFAIYRILFKGYSYGFRVVDLVIMLICFTFFVSTILSKTLLGSGYLAFHGIFIPVISYFVIKTMIAGEEEYKKAIVFLIGGIVCFGILAVTRFAVTYERAFLLSMPSIGIATLSITVVIYIAYSRFWKSIFGLPSLIIATATLVASLSRVYLIIIGISPIFYWIFRKGKGFILILLMLLGTLLLTLFLSYSPGIFKPKRFEKEKERSIARIADIEFWRASIYGRSFSYKEGLSNFKKAPIFGVGLYKGERAITRHNFHIEWLEYGGIMGYLLYCALFLLHFSAVSRNAISDKFIAINMLIIFAILCNSLTNGFMHGIMPYVAFITMGFNEARVKFMIPNNSAS